MKTIIKKVAFSIITVGILIFLMFVSGLAYGYSATKLSMETSYISSALKSVSSYNTIFFISIGIMVSISILLYIIKRKLKKT